MEARNTGNAGTKAHKVTHTQRVKYNELAKTKGRQKQKQNLGWQADSLG